MAFYHQMTDGSGVHSPEVCLPTGGWEVSDWKTRRIAASGASIEVNRAIIQQGLSRQLVYYWFEQHGRRTTSSYALKYYTLIDAIRQGRTDAAIVRLVTPILQGEGEAAADERLRVFMDDLLPLLPPFVPSPSES
jgi:EpsI family protein